MYWTAVVGSRFHSFDGSNHTTQEFDLCYDCEKELIRFLNGCAGKYRCDETERKDEQLAELRRYIHGK